MLHKLGADPDLVLCCSRSGCAIDRRWVSGYHFVEIRPVTPAGNNLFCKEAR